MNIEKTNTSPPHNPITLHICRTPTLTCPPSALEGAKRPECPTAWCCCCCWLPWCRRTPPMITLATKHDLNELLQQLSSGCILKKICRQEWTGSHQHAEAECTAVYALTWAIMPLINRQLDGCSSRAAKKNCTSSSTAGQWLTTVMVPTLAASQQQQVQQQRPKKQKHGSWKCC